MLAGLHGGCLELVGSARVRTIRGRKGKRVAAGPLGGAPHLFLASMAAYVGVDPTKERTWVTAPAGRTRPTAEWARLLAEGPVDAVMTAPPRSLAFRAQGGGHVVVNMTTDRPWSQSFCCLVVGHRDFVRQHPVATKRVLRALVNAADLCGLEPGRAARFLLDKGYTTAYARSLLDTRATTHDALALQALQALPYARWREDDPEDTVRFFALRLHEIGMITSSPQKLIAQGTEWRFVNELKKELKG